jgi:tripartite-type tricarboxylate transporter receptor subunit TctC
MLSSNGALVVNPHLFDSLTYDSLADFKPVGLVAELPMVIVAGKSAPFADLKGLVAYARQNPGKANFASPGTFSFLWMSILEQEAGVKFHNVPYQGSAKALPDLIAGRVDFSIDTIAAVRSHINAGDLKLLAVGPEKRLTLFPDAITTAEAGYPRVQAKAWLGVVAPRGTPDDIVQRLNSEIGAALDSAMVERFQTVGAIPRTSTSAEFGALLAQEHARWKEIVQRTGAKGQ